MIPFLCLGQAPYKANVAIVPVSDTNFFYYKISNLLKDNGYHIDKASKNPFSITTGPKVISGDVTMNLRIMIKEDLEVLVTGNTFIPNVGTTPIENLGMRGSPAESCWKELDKMAKKLGKKVNYRIDEPYKVMQSL